MPTPQQFYFTPADGGAVIDLDDGTSSPNAYHVLQTEGMGEAAVENRVVPLTGRSGGSSVYTRRTERRFTVDLLVPADTAADAQASLKALGRRLMITDGGNVQKFGLLELRGFDGTRRVIRCALEGGLELARQEAQDSGLLFIVPLRFFAPNPNFYDPVERSVNGGAVYPAGGSRVANDSAVASDPSPLDAPFRYPLLEASGAYGGNADSYTLRVDVPGPAVDPVITLPDSPLRETVAFDGTVVEGSTLIVRMGNRPDWGGGFDARLNTGESWQGFIESGTAPLPLTTGANRIWYSQRNIASNQVTLRWYDEFTSGGT